MKSNLAFAKATATLVAVLSTATLASSVSASAGEFQAWAYGGYIYTFPSDVTLQPTRNAPVYTFKDVGWEGKPFTPPPYWGVRGTYWTDAYPGFGFGFDYSHVKVIAERPPALDALVSHFEYTDGLNLLTFDAMYRRRLFDRFTGYAGFGLGVNVPSVEVTLRAPYDITPTHQYELGGPAAQAKLGLEYEIGWNISAFGEYKFAYASTDVTIRHGGHEQDDFFTNQVTFGLSYSLR